MRYHLFIPIQYYTLSKNLAPREESFIIMTYMSSPSMLCLLATSEYSEYSSSDEGSLALSQSTACPPE